MIAYRKVAQIDYRSYIDNSLSRKDSYLVLIGKVKNIVAQWQTKTEEDAIKSVELYLQEHPKNKFALVRKWINGDLITIKSWGDKTKRAENDPLSFPSLKHDIPTDWLYPIPVSEVPDTRWEKFKNDIIRQMQEKKWKSGPSYYEVYRQVRNPVARDDPQAIQELRLFRV